MKLNEENIINFFKGKDYKSYYKGVETVLYNIDFVAVSKEEVDGKTCWIAEIHSSDLKSTQPDAPVFGKELEELMCSGEYHGHNMLDYNSNCDSYINYPIEELKKRFVGKHITNQFDDCKRHIIRDVKIIDDDKLRYNGIAFLNKRGKQITWVSFDMIKDIIKHGSYGFSVDDMGHEVSVWID